MSDQSQGPGWWYASDGRWYPPSSPPAEPAEPAPVASPGPVDPATGLVWDGTQWTVATAPVTGGAPPAAVPAAAAAAPVGPAEAGRGKAALAVLVVLGLLGATFIVVVVTRSRSGDTTGSVAAGAVVSGPDDLPSGDVTLGDKTVVVRGNGGATLKSVAADGSTFTLDGSVEGVDRLGPGSVLLLTGVTVVKITDAQRTGGDVVVKTEPAAITDVVKDGTLAWDQLATGPGTLSVWDSRPGDLEVTDKSTDGDGGDTTDTTTDGPRFAPPGRVPSAGGAAPLAVPPVGALGVAGARADGIVKSGKVGDYSYSYNQTGGLDGSSTYKITITKEGNYVVKLDLDASIEPIISSGDLHVAGSTLDKLHLKTDKFTGTAKVHIEAGTGEDIAPVKQEILSLPIAVTYPVVIYGIPFFIGVKGKFLLEPAFTSKNSTISAQGEASFGGSAGLTWEGGSLSAEGALVTKREDPLKYIEGLGVGVTGMVFAAQFPRLSFGLGYGSSTAGVYLASTTSVGATVGSAIGMVECRQVTVTETVSAGVDAQFIGIEIPLGDRAKAEITKKTWTFYEPKVKACEVADAEN